MKSRILLLVVSFATLTSCNSFNRTIQEPINPPRGWRTVAPGEPRLRQPEHVEPIEITPAEKETIEGTRTKPDVCPIYKLPVFPRMPVLPLEEIARLDPRDMEGLDEIQQRHIQDLRIYGANLRNTIVRSHNTYILNCRALTAKTAPKKQ